MDPQQLDYLRQISRKVDDLVERLSNGGAAPAAPAAGGGFSAADAKKLAAACAKIAILNGDLGAVYQLIIEAAGELTGAQRGFIMMLEEGNKLRFKAGRGVDQQGLTSSEFQASRSVIKQVLQSGEPVLWDSNAGKDATSSMRLLKLQSVMCVPLKYGERTEGKTRVAGVIYLDASGVHASLTDRELQLCTVLAQTASVAIENAIEFQKQKVSAPPITSGDQAQVARLKENVAKITEVGRSISSTLILEDLLVIVVDNIVSLAQAQRGFIMLLEADKSDKTGKAQTIQFKVGRDAMKQTLTEESFSFSTTIAKKTIESKKAIVTTAVSEGDASLSMVQMKLRSLMCVPLIEKQNVIGLVYVDSQQENREFNESDAEILESLCGQAAVAIVNAKLYKEASTKEQLRHELNLGAKIQSDLLPKVIPQIDGLELFGFMKPAKEVGGDYYDFITHEGTKRSLTIAIGDVSGKGVGAGLVMAMARSTLRSFIQREKLPTTTLPIVQGLNTHLCADIPKGMFMTLNVFIWNADTNTLKYTAAGHEHILIYRSATREVEKIKAGGVACGVLKQSNALMKEKELKLETGDHVLLYTDGVSEAMNAAHEEFELERVIELVKQHGHLTPKDLCDRIYIELEEFRGEAEVHDDITLVALRATDSNEASEQALREKLAKDSEVPKLLEEVFGGD